MFTSIHTLTSTVNKCFNVFFFVCLLLNGLLQPLDLQLAAPVLKLRPLITI